MSRVHVLQVVRPAAGGIRQHVLELLRRVHSDRYSFSVAAPQAFLHSLPPDLAGLGRALVDIKPQLSPASDLLAATRLAQFIRGRADIVHAHGLRAAFVATLAHRLRPFSLVVTVHNLVPGGRFTRLGLRLIGQQANCIVAVSQSVADGLVAGDIPASKVCIIPNGIDTAHFSPPAPAARRVFTIGCVARLSPEKGVDVLLRAARELPETAFLLAGDGPERARLETIAPPNVRWLGRVDDVREVYAASDALAVPSRAEGQGLVALEALAFGVPVVASSVGGLAEMLTEGETALLVPPNDPSALAAALRRLRDDAALRAHLARNGRKLVQSHYDVHSMIEAIEAVYATAARGGAMPSSPSD